MRQTFPFSHPKHKPAQALAALKSRVRKYLKRERRKPLPEGVDYWDFDCKVGPSEDAAQPVHVAEIVPKMDALSAEGATHVYVEILAKPGKRTPRKKADARPAKKEGAASSMLDEVSDDDEEVTYNEGDEGDDDTDSERFNNDDDW